MNRVKEVERINRKDVELQLRSDTVGNAGKWDVNKSWHAQYKDSAYVYVGGLPYDISEGDIIVIFSQFGEIVDVNMPRDKDTGKPKGFAFIAYEDQRSTVLAVDNFNGAILNKEEDFTLGDAIGFHWTLQHILFVVRMEQQDASVVL